MTPLYLILDVFDEVPQFKSAVMPEQKALEYVKSYCEENDVPFKGLDYFRYYPRYYKEARAFLMVAPVDLTEGVKVGFYWGLDKEPKLETVYPETDDD